MTSVQQQLFQAKPSIELIYECIKRLGFTDLKDKKTVTRLDMEIQNISAIFRIMDDKFAEIYRPCKYKQFCSTYNTKDCITITRQLLKMIKYELVGKEVMVNGKKTTMYRLMSESERYRMENYKNGIHVNSKPVIISFD
jgi:hypothetical protein